MTATPLIRDRLRPLYQAAGDADTHPGLLLQSGYSEHSDSDKEAKAEHVKRICRSTPGDFYTRAFERWRKATEDGLRFRSVVLEVETRLFTGLTGSGMLETGCAISHSYGVPCIPGSSVKGIVSAHARERLGAKGDASAAGGTAICDELFGAPASEDRPAGLSGLITFHDAWWVPGSAKHPLVQEVVTTHHPDYYGKDGEKPATDFDSPVPNAQVAVHGAFLFVLEGPIAWLALAEQMLIAALSTHGAGAKTRTGYGVFGAPADAPDEHCAETRCEWVDRTIADLAARNRAPEEQILRSRGLARAWSAIEDPALKEAAYRDIRARWQEKGWWDDVPRGKSAEAAKAIYDNYPTT